MTADGGERRLERCPRLGGGLLGDPDEHEVDQGQLRQAAGHRAAAERRLARRRGEHVVGHLDDRRAREVGEGDGGRSATAGLGERVDGVGRDAGVRDADRHVAGLQQRGAGQGDVGVGPGEGDLADAVQLLLEVHRDERAGAHAVHVDAAGGDERVDHGLQHRDVQVGRRLLDRPGVGEGDLLDDRREVVARADVAADHAPAVVGAAGLGGQGQAELRVAGQAEGPAEPDDRGLRGGALLRQLGDRAGGDCRAGPRAPPAPPGARSATGTAGSRAAARPARRGPGRQGSTRWHRPSRLRT